MRTTLLSIGALALFGVGLTVPAPAQMMCSPGQQAQASSPSGMMCGGAMGAAVDDPMADKPAQKPQASGMCPCCRNMAMMKGGMMGGQKDMPGMQMPK
jgi:hypothetical protein